MAQTFISLIKIPNRWIATYLGKEKAYLREISSKLVKLLYLENLEINYTMMITIP